MRRKGTYYIGVDTAPDWNTVTEAAARQLKGEPNTRLSNRRELRWGSHGSFKLAIAGQAIGSWYDWEAREGGRGALQLVEYLLGMDREGALNWLRQRGHLDRRLNEPTPPLPTSNSNADRPVTNRSRMARDIWISSEAIPKDHSHPARRWFENRNLWRQELPAPPMLRWKTAGGAHMGAGSIVAMLATPETWASAWPSLPTATAVQIISVDEGGGPSLDRPADKGGLNKRSVGAVNGAVSVIGNPVLSEAVTPVRIAEGLADALAIAARYDGPVVAMCGTSGMRNPALAAWLASAESGAIIHADRDQGREGRAPAGTTAAGALREAIASAGGNASAVYPPEGYKDAAEAAKAAGFSPLEEDWIEYARTLAETTDWPRWEIARVAQIATSGV